MLSYELTKVLLPEPKSGEVQERAKKERET